ncbi:MAG TPA: YkgJ family cysteine cluster protein [Polyangiaceae bacterium]|jgi:hypothetical protein
MNDGADAGEGVPDCLACGTCCFSTLERYVPVTGDDYARLGEERAERLVHWIGNRAYLRLEDGHCAALVVDASSGRFVCSTYDTRPAICRELERGSAACRGEIATKGERPLTALRAAQRARGASAQQRKPI